MHGAFGSCGDDNDFWSFHFDCSNLWVIFYVFLSLTSIIKFMMLFNILLFPYDNFVSKGLWQLYQTVTSMVAIRSMVVVRHSWGVWLYVLSGIWYVGLVKVKNGQQKDMTHDEIWLHVDKYNLDSWFSKCRNHYRLIRMVYVIVWRDIESSSLWPLITFTWSRLQIWNLTWQSLMWFAIGNHKRQFLVQFNNQRTPPLQSYES